MEVCWWPVSINVFVAASVCIPPAGSSFRTPSKWTESERIRSEISILEKIQEFHQNTVAASQFVPGFESQSVTKNKKTQCEMARQAINGFLLVPFLNLIWRAFVWMSHHPLSLKENPWSWPCPETLAQVFLDQCWCGTAELDFCVTFQFLRCPDFNASMFSSKCILNICLILVDFIESWACSTLNIGV